MTGPGTGVNTRWLDLPSLVIGDAAEMNRTESEAMELAEQLVYDPNVEVWTAHSGDQILGFVSLTLGRKKSDKHTALVRTHVVEDARGFGVGSALLKAALTWADENGIKRITALPYIDRGMTDTGWRPKPESRKVLRFFGLHGFSQEGLLRAAVREGDRYRDMAVLARVR